LKANLVSWLKVTCNLSSLLLLKT